MKQELGYEIRGRKGAEILEKVVRESMAGKLTWMKDLIDGLDKYRPR